MDNILQLTCFNSQIGCKPTTGVPVEELAGSEFPGSDGSRNGGFCVPPVKDRWRFCFSTGNDSIDVRRGTPPKFNSSPLKNHGGKTFAFPIGFRSLFRGDFC